MVDIPGSTASTAAFPGDPIFGSSFSGEFESFGDSDWIRVTLTAGVIYKFYASAEGSGQDIGNSILRLRNSAGTQVAINDDASSSQNSFISFTPATTGTYFVDIRSATGKAGLYSVAVTATAATDFRLTVGDDAYTGLANQRIIGDKGDDTITIGAGLHALGEQGDDSITGNAFANFISGGLGNDTLFGDDGADTIFGDGGLDFINGGSGNDKLYGGDGADYIFDISGLDTIWGGEGGDFIEAGDDNDTVAGEGGDDLLLGQDGNDILNGGAGIDDMDGADGNDTFYVDNAADKTGEMVGGGNDTVFTTVTYALAAGAEIETFATTSVALTGAINLTGNEFGQRINGNNGNNVIYGAAGNDLLVGYSGNDNLEGGYGADTLKGISGIDKFVFRQNQVAASGADHISDFGADDFIYFDVPSGPTGALNPANFVVGPNALDAADRFIYYTPTHALYFDADGNGAGAKILFAVLDNAFALTAGDIILF